MNWVQGMLDDEAIFPSKIGMPPPPFPARGDNAECPAQLTTPARPSAGVPFPKTFQATVKSIVRRLFRVYAHLYNHHFAQLCALSIEGESGARPHARNSCEGLLALLSCCI